MAGPGVPLNSEGDVFIDPFLLTLTLICVIILMLGNLYFIAHYSHHADGGFGSSSAVKFLLMLSFMVVEGQILMLPLDVLNYREGTNVDMFVFW